MKGAVFLAQDGDLVLPESAAIMRYLAAKYQVPDHWYPSMHLLILDNDCSSSHLDESPRMDHFTCCIFSVCQSGST